MIGNDVVDLRDPEVDAAALHPRFDRRVFDAQELERLRESGAPHRLRWMLWAAKEAAFKALRKRDPRVIFSPRRFAVRLEPTLRGEVRVGGRRLRLTLFEDATAVHAVAVDGDVGDARIVSEARLLEVSGGLAPDASAAARELAIETYARRVGARPDEVGVERCGRVPRLTLHGAPADADLSLSHHGRLVAFACELPTPCPEEA